MTGSFPLPAKGLVVREPWISAMLDGRKTWELRGHATKQRGKVALIAAGTGQVYGEVEVVDVVGPLSLRDLECTQAFHLVNPGLTDLVRYKKVFAWVLANCVRYERPVAYRHPQGAVVWVNLAECL